jgi:hypothetical protein
MELRRKSVAARNQTEYTRDMAETPDKEPSEAEPAQDPQSGGRPISDSLREAVEGAFAATGLTRDRAQDLSDRTRDRAQDLVEEVSRLGRDAREALDGMRLVSRDEMAGLSDRIAGIEARLEALESRSGHDSDG